MTSGVDMIVAATILCLGTKAKASPLSNLVRFFYII